MITIKKLKTLGKKTLLRKIVLLLQQMEHDRLIDLPYLDELYRLIQERVQENTEVGQACSNLRDLITTHASESDVIRGINTLRYALQGYLGITAGDWDFYEPGTSRLDASKRTVLPMQVYLDDIRSPFNVGSIFRTADSLGVEKLVLSPFTADPKHPRAFRTAMGCIESMPWERMPPEQLSGYDGIFALELGGTPLEEFTFPDRGIVIIGSEELGVSPEALKAADRGYGRVSIPLCGTKGSLNVSVSFGILLYNWKEALSKKSRNP